MGKKKKRNATRWSIDDKYANDRLSKINGYIVDISKKEVLEACLKEIEKSYNQIDIIVNNAGVCKLNTFENMSDEERDFHFNINIKGT